MCTVQLILIYLKWNRFLEILWVTVFLPEIVRTVAAKPVNKHTLPMFYVRK